MPKLHDQPVEQGLAGEAGPSVCQARIENVGKHRSRVPLRDGWSGLGSLARPLGFVKGQYHFTCQHTGRVLLLMHGPDNIARLGDRRLEFSATLAGSLQYGREISDVPMLKDDRKPSVGPQKAQTGFDAAG